MPAPRHHRNLENSRWSTPQGPQSTHLLVISVLAKDKDHWGAREQSDYRQAQLLLDDLLCVGEGPYLVGESGEVRSAHGEGAGQCLVQSRCDD